MLIAVLGNWHSRKFQFQHRGAIPGGKLLPDNGAHACVNTNWLETVRNSVWGKKLLAAAPDVTIPVSSCNTCNR